jgi:hypothetical protein
VAGGQNSCAFHAHAHGGEPREDSLESSAQERTKNLIVDSTFNDDQAIAKPLAADCSGSVTTRNEETR